MLVIVVVWPPGSVDIMVVVVAGTVDVIVVAAAVVVETDTEVVVDVIVVAAAVVVTVVVAVALAAACFDNPIATRVPGVDGAKVLDTPSSPNIFWSPLESWPVVNCICRFEPRFISRRTLPLLLSKNLR